ncbi:Rrf2 family transcriptional regulator [Glaciimonas sp. PCH181]|uniref:RrF2 family transcriptional regulator n=1 Tax=Glaciimonas sp. PCH181 TaxID=2133943 RepID=UPI000D3A93A7|nr:Rrf2 family transcriptional regulator [Glaciimonas sp. PCH181]PUA19528.1 transcriptional regulator [Glaciimonas sp. PCH181]
MAHISTGVEYALHCLLFLVDQPPGSPATGARDLAELQGVSSEFVAKLFTKLRKADLIISTEGVTGGFRLARPAEKISVLDVTNAIDGEKSLFDCKEVRSRCAIFNDNPPIWATRGVCSIHAIMLEAEQRVRETLAAHSLADLSNQVKSKASAAYSKQVVNWLENRTSIRIN